MCIGGVAMVSAVRSGSNTDILEFTDRGTQIVNGEKELGKDAFLQLLVAQMQHQDPFNSQDPTKYVEQMATFSMLEQMTNLNKNVELLVNVNSGGLINSALANTTSAIGKEVEVEMPVEGDTDGATTKYSGVVKSTFIQDGRVYMEVEVEGGLIKEFPYESLVKIGSSK